MTNYDKRIEVGLITRDKKGTVLHSRIITVRDREELEQQVEFYKTILNGYDAEIKETLGALFLIWTDNT